jgi:hypothetical protein
MGAFSDRFDDPERPGCYGDPDYFDLSHEVCQNCRWKGTCRLKVSGLRQQPGRTATPQSTVAGATNQAYRGPKAKVYEEPIETDTFTSVLMHNAGLNAVTSISETLTDALSQIPRKKYPMIRKKV